MKTEHLALNAAKFSPLNCIAINQIKGGEDTCTPGYNYTLNGETKTCYSDCYRIEEDGKWHTYFYDKEGKTMDECIC